MQQRWEGNQNQKNLGILIITIDEEEEEGLSWKHSNNNNNNNQYKQAKLPKEELKIEIEIHMKRQQRENRSRCSQIDNDNDDAKHDEHIHRYRYRNRYRNRNRRPSPMRRHAALLLPLLVLCLQLQQVRTSTTTSTTRNTQSINNDAYGHNNDAHLYDYRNRNRNSNGDDNIRRSHPNTNNRMIYTSPVVAATALKSSTTINAISSNSRSNSRSNRRSSGTTTSRGGNDKNYNLKNNSRGNGGDGGSAGGTTSSGTTTINTGKRNDNGNGNDNDNDNDTLKTNMSSKRGRKKRHSTTRKQNRKLLNVGGNGSLEVYKNMISKKPKVVMTKPPKENGTKAPKEFGNGKPPGGGGGGDKPGGGGDKKEKEFGNEKPGGGGGGGGNKNKKTISPAPTYRPSENPSLSPTPPPTVSPTYFPTTSAPTIKKGNPTPSPTLWIDSWLGEDLILSLSTMTADEDQLEFSNETDISAGGLGGGGGPRRMRGLSSSSSSSSSSGLSRRGRSLERIYAADVMNGSEGDMIELIFTSVADMLCKYTNFVILSSVTASNNNNDVDPSTNDFTDYCKKDGVIIDTNSYYSNRATVIVAPVSAKNDLSQVVATEFPVFEPSIVGNYLHWIQWDIKCPIVQISRTIWNEENRVFDSTLSRVQAEGKLVMDTVTSTQEMNDILMSKNENILSVSASGWEIFKSQNFMEPRKKDREEGGNRKDNTDSLENTDDELTPERYRVLQPIRVAGLIMMAIFFFVVAFLIRAGKKRDDKAWEARMLEASPINGDLVSYEGVNFLLQSSRIEAESLQRLSPSKEGHYSSSSMAMSEDRQQYKDYQENKSRPAQPEKSPSTSESGHNSGSFQEDLNAGLEEVITFQKRTSILRKNKPSVTRLCVSPTEIEAAASPNSNELSMQGNSFFPSSLMGNNELGNPNNLRNTNRAEENTKKLNNRPVERTAKEPMLTSNAPISFTSWMRS